MEGYKEFLELRKYLFYHLIKLQADGKMEHHKTYEGEFDITYRYSNYFEPVSENKCINAEITNVTLALHCYVIGPSRHYMWSGKTLLECVQKARKDIEEWCEEACDDC